MPKPSDKDVAHLFAVIMGLVVVSWWFTKTRLRARVSEQLIQSYEQIVFIRST